VTENGAALVALNRVDTTAAALAIAEANAVAAIRHAHRAGASELSITKASGRARNTVRKIIGKK